MKTTMQNGVTTVEIIYAAGTTVGGKEIAYATVEKRDRLPIKITSRMGDVIHVSDDALDCLIVALQQIQKQISTGVLKRG